MKTKKKIKTKKNENEKNFKMKIKKTNKLKIKIYKHNLLKGKNTYWSTVGVTLQQVFSVQLPLTP